MKFIGWVFALMMGTGVAVSAAALTRLETGDITAIEAHIDSATLVLFDIDTTLVKTDHMLGSEAWADMMTRRYILQGMSPLQARAELTPLWNAVLIHSVVRPLDAEVQTTLRRLQRRGIRVMGISDKDPEMAYIRLEHLRLCDAHLSATAPHRGVLNIPANACAKMVHGVLFTGVYNNPGDVLASFLDELGYYPSNIVMISNKAHLLHEIETAVSHVGIPFVSVRHSGLDAIDFRSDISEVQLNLFNRVMSDDAARALQPTGTSFWPL